MRRLTEAFATGDMARVARDRARRSSRTMSVWHEIGRAEPRRGKDELRASMGEVDYTITATTHDILASDEHAVLLADATATAMAGRSATGSRRSITSGTAGSTERWAFSDDTAAITAFFA